jgi:uncharacterized protein with HEPN domain
MNRDFVYPNHIGESIEKIENYVTVGERVFFETTYWQDAVIRNLEIIGEATKRLSGDLKDDNAEIPWREIAGLRDILIHDYMGVDLYVVWNVVVLDLPKLKKTVMRLLEEYEE